MLVNGKEARLKGNNGSASSSSVKKKIVKRKMDGEVSDCDDYKVWRTEGLLSELTELAEAMAQPRQGQ